MARLDCHILGRDLCHRLRHSFYQHLSPYHWCLLHYNLSYSFPFMFLLALMWHTDASSLDSFDLMSMTVTKVDFYQNWPKWQRAISSGGKKRTTVKVSLFLLWGASFANCGLCAYCWRGAIETYKSSVAAPFTCTAQFRIRPLP